LKTAILTGASSGIGNALIPVLCHLGYEVYGFGRNFSETSDSSFENQNPTNPPFHPITLDLQDTAKLVETIQTIKKTSTSIDLLINNAGVAYYGLHEELNPKKIQEMVRTNLEVPMILTNLLLRDLKKSKGDILNIASVTARGRNPHGACYGATKSGLLNFSDSIFDEARKHGVSVTTLSPDMTKTNLYRNATFTASDEDDASLSPDDVADAVNFILTQRSSVVTTELTLRPQLHRIKKRS